MVNEMQWNVFTFENSSIVFSESVVPVNKPDETELIENKLYVPWGDFDNLPTELRELKRKNPDLVSALDWKARALYSSGIGFKIMDRNTEKEADPKAVKDIRKTVSDFLFINRHYLLQSSVDFYDLMNVFGCFVTDRDTEKIVRIGAFQAKNCRLSPRNAKGEIKEIFTHESFTGVTSRKSKGLSIYKNFDFVNPSLSTLKENIQTAFHIAYPSGENYYSTPHWYSIKESKWYDVASKIPIVKEALLRNIAILRYHIEMPDYWMTERYPNFNSMTALEKKQKTEAEFKIINDILSGPANAGKSISTMYKVMAGKDFGGWRITPIDDKIKDGILLADSSEATIKIFSATSIDPSLHGLIPGAGGSNRSGSDKREALNIYMSLIAPHDHLVMQPFIFAHQVNEVDTEDFRTDFSIQKPFLQTLDKITPSQRETKPENAD